MPEGHESRKLVAAAGCMARCTMEAFISPFNLVKVRLQVDPNLREQSLPAAFRTVSTYIVGSFL
jgi:hypothetical protein